MTWAPDYCTLAELKSYLKISDSVDDAFAALWITAVSRNVDDFCGRQFGQVAAAEDRYYTPVWDRPQAAWVCEIDDLQDTTGLTFKDQNGTAIPAATANSAGYTLLPRNAAAKGRPYERVKLSGLVGGVTGWVWGVQGWPGGELTAHGVWGWTAGTAGPTIAKTGLFLQAARLEARRQSPFGIAGSPDANTGTELRLLAQLDPDFRTTLKPVIRDWWAA